jgi:hypothetical protein
VATNDSGLCVLCEVGAFGNENIYINDTDSLHCEMRAEAKEVFEHRLYNKTPFSRMTSPRCMK